MNRLRYLTPAEKRRYMRDLAEALRERDIDAEMIPRRPKSVAENRSILPEGE